MLPMFVQSFVLFFKELAKKTWENFQKQNDSVIIDECHGMLRSKISCPKCEQNSFSFDIYNHISLPLPRRPLPLQMQEDKTLTVSDIL